MLLSQVWPRDDNHHTSLRLSLECAGFKSLDSLIVSPFANGVPDLDALQVGLKFVTSVGSGKPDHLASLLGDLSMPVSGVKGGMSSSVGTVSGGREFMAWFRSLICFKTGMNQ